MATLPYSEKITNAKLMADGIKEMKDHLPIGVQESAATNLENLREEIEALNSKQESLKASLKKATEELNNKIGELDKTYSDLKKRIKLDIEQSLWRKFGIEDKR
ncbi:MAG: membrane-binding protein [Flavobacteriaceae bacterium]|nr:membrane-binding protein [Flavobacteriaceae bacterium]